jgi:hypothetical protein
MPDLMPLTELAVRCLMSAQRDLSEALRTQAESISELATSVSDLTDALGDYIATDRDADDEHKPPPEFDLEGKRIPRR